MKLPQHDCLREGGAKLPCNHSGRKTFFVQQLQPLQALLCPVRNHETLPPARLFGPLRSRLASDSALRKAPAGSTETIGLDQSRGGVCPLRSEWLYIGDSTHGALKAEAAEAAEAGHGGRETDR